VKSKRDRTAKNRRAHRDHPISGGAVTRRRPGKRRRSYIVSDAVHFRATQAARTRRLNRIMGRIGTMLIAVRDAPRLQRDDSAQSAYVAIRNLLEKVV